MRAKHIIKTPHRMSSIQDLIGEIEKNTKRSQASAKKATPAKPENTTERKKRENKREQKREYKTENRRESRSENNSETKESREKKAPLIKKGRNTSAKGRKPASSSPAQQTEKRSIKSGKKGSAKKKSPVKKRFFVTQVCTSKKSCGEKFGPYVWERLCNDHNQDPECKSFEIQGFLFEQSPCQGACKKAANIRMKEKDAPTHTQFSYLTPIKASKLIKMIKSGATPENIKRI